MCSKTKTGLSIQQTCIPLRPHDVLPAGTAATINLIEHFIIDLVNYSLMHLNFFHNIFINGRDSCLETLTLITIKGAREELRITSSQIMRSRLFFLGAALLELCDTPGIRTFLSTAWGDTRLLLRTSEVI